MRFAKSNGSDEFMEKDDGVNARELLLFGSTMVPFDGLRYTGTKPPALERKNLRSSIFWISEESNE